MLPPGMSLPKHLTLSALSLLLACGTRDLSGTWRGEQTCTGDGETMDVLLELSLESSADDLDYELIGLLAVSGESDSAPFTGILEWDGRLYADPAGAISLTPEVIARPDSALQLDVLSGAVGLSEDLQLDAILTAAEADLDCMLVLEPSD